jgi:hypothetical protein
MNRSFGRKRRTDGHFEKRKNVSNVVHLVMVNPAYSFRSDTDTGMFRRASYDDDDHIHYEGCTKNGTLCGIDGWVSEGATVTCEECVLLNFQNEATK